MAEHNSGSIYVIDSYLPHNKNGLIFTLENIVSSPKFVIPDSSLLPVISNVDREKLTTERISNVVDTVNTISSLLASPKTFTTRITKSNFMKKAKEEIDYSQKNKIVAIQEQYSRFVEKLGKIKTWEVSKENEEKFILFVKAINFVESALDLKSKDQDDFDDYIDTLAFASTLAVSSNTLGLTILSLNKTYSVLIDALFGIPYKMLGENEKENKIARSINNPKLSLTSCDLGEANQPFVIERDLNGKLKFPHEFYKIKEERRNEIFSDLVKYFSNLSLLINGISKKETEIKMQTTENINVQKEKKIEEIPVQEKNKKKQKKEQLKEKPTLEEDLNASKKIEKTPHTRKWDFKKISGENLLALYEQTKEQKELSELYSDGKLRAKILSYQTLKEIALQTGFKKITDYLDKDLNNIKEYLIRTKKQEIEQKRNCLEEEIKSLESHLLLFDDYPLMPHAKRNFVTKQKETEINKPQKISKKEKKEADVKERAERIHNNIQFLFGRNPTNQVMPKDFLRKSSGVKSLAAIIKRAKNKGLLGEKDYVLNNGIRNFNYTQKISFAFANVIKRKKPPIL